MKKLIWLMPVIIVLFLSGLVFGITFPGIGQATEPGFTLPTRQETVTKTIGTIVNWLFWLLMAFATVVIIVAAYLFLTAGGNPEQVEKARSYIIYALIGLVVGFLAKAIVALIAHMLGITSPPL